MSYEQETETRHCAKCPKHTSENNAVSAKSHAASHMTEEKGVGKSEKKQEENDPERTEVNAGYEHYKTMDGDTGGERSPNNKRDR